MSYQPLSHERPSEPSGMTAGIPVDHGQSLTPDRRPNNAESATPDSTTKQPIYPPSYLMLSVVTSIFAFFLTLMLMWCCTIPAVVFGANAYSAARRKDYNESKKNSRRAFCCNAVCMIVTFLLYTAGVIAGITTYLVLGDIAHLRG